MIHIVHGSNIAASRNYIHELKTSQTLLLSEFRSLDVSPDEVLVKYFTSSIFADKTLPV